MSTAAVSAKHSLISIFPCRVDLMKHTYRVGVTIPVLKLFGDYDVDARVLVVPIKGVGTFEANASKSLYLPTLTAKVTQDLLQRTVRDRGSSKPKLWLDRTENAASNSIHSISPWKSAITACTLTIFSMATQSSVRPITFHREQFFYGAHFSGQAANDVLNENKQEFIEAALPFVQRKTSEILLEIAGKITESLDYDEAFPEKWAVWSILFVFTINGLVDNNTLRE